MSQTTIGRYTLIEELGRGGMATVYRASDPHFKREVAIKVLPREFLHHPGFRARFQREAETVASLQHPNIVPVYDFGEEDGQPYLVMRCMNGGTLTQRLESGPLPLEQSAEIVGRLASALETAHCQGIVHRDLKPDNIMFDQAGCPYLTDFGLAKITQSGGQITGSGAILGTPAYMSPEQILGKEIDARADVYALGLILYQMLTGHHPFPVDTPVAYLTAHLHQPMPELEDASSCLAPGITPVIQKAAAKAREHRYASAADFAADLDAALAGGTTLAGIEAAAAQATPRRPRRWVWAAGGLLAAALIGGLWLFVLPRLSETPDALDELSGSTEPTTPAHEIAILETATDIPLPTATPRPSIGDLVPAALRETRIAFASDEAQAGSYEIYAMRVNGTDFVRLTLNDVDDREPAWSPDGARIAFSSNRDGDWEIYVMDATGLNQTRLTASPGRDSSPAWSPDGTRLAFVSERDENPEIYVMEPNGSSPVRLTDHPGRDKEPAWSPDGTQLAFVSSRRGSDDIYLMFANGGDSSVLVSNPGTDSSPVWSPDGSRIAFVSDRVSGNTSGTGSSQVYLYTVGSEEVTEITGNTPELISHLSWSPDGTWLVQQANASPEVFDARADSTVGGLPGLETNTQGQIRLVRVSDGLVLPLFRRLADTEDPAWGPIR